MTNLETHLHNCLCESRGFKIRRSSHRRSSTKKCAFKNFEKLTGKHLWRSFFFNNVAGLRPVKIKLRHRFFPVSFTKFLRTPFLHNLFYIKLSGDCFWIGLMVKKFNYVSLIFLNLQLNDAPPEWSLLFWYNEGHLLMRKISGFNSATAIICVWNHREHVLTFFRT